MEGGREGGILNAALSWQVGAFRARQCAARFPSIGDRIAKVKFREAERGFPLICRRCRIKLKEDDDDDCFFDGNARTSKRLSIFNCLEMICYVKG